MRRTIPIRILLAVMLALAAPAAAREETGSFSVYVGGVRAAILGYAFSVSENRYHVRARAEASGLLRLFYETAYATEAAGRIAGSGYGPDFYREERISRDGTETGTFRFRGGVPGRKTYDPPRGPEDLPLDPADQGGTVDPMTAAFAIMRDTAEDALCAVDLAVWDGERRGRIRLSGPREARGDMLCDGVFSRVAGYSQADLAEQRDFPFTVRYAQGSDGVWRMVDARAPSSAGRVVLRRR
jgi:hypothetical protein